MARDGHVGQEVYDRTNALVKEGRSRQEAFEQIAQERGSNPGTIGANFYRVARKQAENGKPSRAPRTAPARRPTPAQAPPTAGMAAQLEACIQQMVDEAVDRRMQRLIA